MDEAVFDKGLAIRRAVMGPDHVDKSMATADDFTSPLQELVTQYCWGEVWGRPELYRRHIAPVHAYLGRRRGLPFDAAGNLVSPFSGA